MKNFSKRHFGDIDIKDLIRQYKQHECLWNINSLDYKRAAMRYRAWLAIANYFHKNVSEVKRKIKYLRSAYVAERKKVIASKKNGDSELYKPLLFYFNELEFLDNVVVWRKGPNGEVKHSIKFESFEIPPEETEDFISYVEYETTEQKSPEIISKVDENIEKSPVFTPSPPPENDEEPETKTSISISSRPQKRMHEESDILNKQAKKCIPSTSKENNELINLYSSFGKTISLQLQQLPLETAIVTMSDIHTILTNKILEYIRSTKNDNRTYSQSDSDETIIFPSSPSRIHNPATEFNFNRRCN